MTRGDRENVLATTKWLDRRCFGEGCVLYLLAREASARLKALGKEVHVSVVLDAFRIGKSELPKLCGTLSGVSIERIEEPGEAAEVILSVGGDWKIRITGPGGHLVRGVSGVECFERGELQDTPDSSPGHVVVGVGAEKRSDASSWAHFAYIKQESHYFGGERWDPTSRAAAVTCYHDNGTVRWRAHFRRGILQSPAGGGPCFESFWPSGVTQIQEYGSRSQGRYRNSEEGPAYSEFFPNGGVALEIFTRRGSHGRGCASHWSCRTLEGKSRRASKQDIQLIRSDRLTLGNGDQTEVLAQAEAGEFDPTGGFEIRHIFRGLPEVPGFSLRSSRGLARGLASGRAGREKKEVKAKGPLR